MHSEISCSSVCFRRQFFILHRFPCLQAGIFFLSSLWRYPQEYPFWQSPRRKCLQTIVLCFKSPLNPPTPKLVARDGSPETLQYYLWFLCLIEYNVWFIQRTLILEKQRHFLDHLFNRIECSRMECSGGTLHPEGAASSSKKARSQTQQSPPWLTLLQKKLTRSPSYSHQTDLYVAFTTVCRCIAPLLWLMKMTATCYDTHQYITVEQLGSLQSSKNSV